MMWAEHVARTCVEFRSERAMKRDNSEDVCDCSLPPRFRWEPHSSELLHSE